MAKAKLICSDGTEVEISKETEANLRARFREKKFEPIMIHQGCFKVAIEGCMLKISTDFAYSGVCCYQNENEARKFIEAIQYAIDFIENR